LTQLSGGTRAVIAPPRVWVSLGKGTSPAFFHTSSTVVLTPAERAKAQEKLSSSPCHPTAQTSAMWLLREEPAVTPDTPMALSEGTTLLLV
jgi:hypothetical protein